MWTDVWPEESHKQQSSQCILTATAELLTRNGFNQACIDDVMIAALPTKRSQKNQYQLIPGFHVNTLQQSAISHAQVLRMAIPIILANMAVPLLGLVDTAVIGHEGDASDLGAIALGSLVFNFVYWAFGFLRMGTTGFIAQASGAHNHREVRSALGRALLIGLLIGCLLICMQLPIIQCALWLLDASSNVEKQIDAYWDIRIWAAPATLATYAIMGTLIGLGKTRDLLWLQLCLNGINLVLDVVFVVGFDWGVKGIAWGTLIAEWLCALIGFAMIIGHLHIPGEPFWRKADLFHPAAIIKTISTNADIMWRTLFLLTGFSFFANQGASSGDNILAANHILLQFISLSAFFLDGFAFALEAQVGKAIGSGNRQLFDRITKVSTRLAACTALVLMLLMVLAGATVVTWLTGIMEIQNAAVTYLPYAAVYVLISFAAFQLDGIFIGAMMSRAMRNASFFSLLIFIATSMVMIDWWGNHGLWIAFNIYVIARAITLGFYFPQLRRQFSDQ